VTSAVNDWMVLALHTVLVIGGYGFFGERICASLCKVTDIHLLIGGRNPESARRLAQALGLENHQGVAIDVQNPSLSQVLSDLSVGTVIHTAGPFQGQEYGVARAAIAAGCHYVDLADGRDFVSRIDVLEPDAKARGVTVVSGASSVPALSSAVVDRYLTEFDRLESIQIGISSGARAPGLATVRGVFSYAGKPVRTLRGGSWTTSYGWRNLERHQFPAPLGRRWLGSCDVPDLEILPSQYSAVRTVSFKAGFASDAGHLLVWVLAGLVQVGIIASMTPLASPLNRISRWIEPLVSDKGGMFVMLNGIGRNGQPHRRTWNLIAAHNHGPFIPCGAAIVLATKLAAGVKLPVGAMPCVGLLTVAEYLQALQGLDVKEVVE
jgi:saccharopine dehydrogenase-like NADP-dependent oxidoreductase